MTRSPASPKRVGKYRVIAELGPSIEERRIRNLVSLVSWRRVVATWEARRD